MSGAPDAYAVALASERAGYVRAGRFDRVIPVDAELARVGWCVAESGDLVQYAEKPQAKRAGRPPKERAVADPAPERAVE